MIATTAPADGISTPGGSPPGGSDLGWSDEEIESLLGSAILLAIVTAVVYLLVLRPILAPKDRAGARAAAAAAGQQQQRGQQRGGTRAGQPGAGGVGTARRRQQQVGAIPGRNVGVGGGDDGASSSSSVPSVLSRGTRRPPHLSPSCPGGPQGSACLVEGIVPFRRTEAGGYEAQLAKRAEAEVAAGASSDRGGEGGAGDDTNGGSGSGDGSSSAAAEREDLITSNRRSRARLFARILSPTVSTPPPRGSNVVVCVPSADAPCPGLHRVLFLLGTYFNLFLVICLSPLPVSDIGGPDEVAKERDLMDGLRSEIRSSPPPTSEESEPAAKPIADGGAARGVGIGAGVGVPREVLPDHRIVASRSVEGRVAFVRQMHRPEFILDYDAEVKGQLGRFGFTVLLYGQEEEGEGEAAAKRVGEVGGRAISSSLGRSVMP